MLLPIVVLLSLFSSSYATNSPQNIFIQCLVNNSEPSNPIIESIFTQNSPSFPSILQAYIRNLRFNTTKTPKPFLIITPLHVSHIQASIICGQKHNFQMKIRSGGHDYEGVSYVSNVPFFILDMFNLRSIEIDINTETAWIQSGATLGEVYYRIAEKSKTHAFPAGVCPTVGVGGHVSGAGYGNLMRKYGTSTDNVIDAEIIDAKGRLLDRKSMGEDLFWAIRGGGGANFGVVLSYKIKLVKVPKIVTVFEVKRTLEQNASDIVYNWQHVAPTTSNDLFIRLILEVVKDAKNGAKTIRATFISLFLGDSKTLVSLMNETFPQLGLREEDCIETSWLQSVFLWDNIKIDTPFEILLERQPQLLRYLKRKSDYVKEPIPKEGLEGIWKKMIELEKGVMFFNPYGGKMDEISPKETPLPHRAGNLWKIQYQANWNEAGEELIGFGNCHKVVVQKNSKLKRPCYCNGASETVVLNMSTLAWSVVTSVQGRVSVASEGLSLVVSSYNGEDVLVSFGGYNGRYNSEVYVLKPSHKSTLQSKIIENSIPDSVSAVPNATRNTGSEFGAGHEGKIWEIAVDNAYTTKSKGDLISVLKAEREELESSLSKEKLHTLQLKQELADAESSNSDLYKELQSVRGQLAAEQSRCFKLEVEVAELGQKLQNFGTLQKELELLQRQKAASEQAALSAKQRQGSGGVWGWLAGTPGQNADDE